MKNKNDGFAPSNIGVKNIPTGSLVANPHNPRMLFDRAPLDILKFSIKRVGVLVPLTVYWSDKKSTYIILDGQRRWTCAKELGLPEVPVNQVAEPTLVQNIVTMFQIHKLREDWELMPTALKLELLMANLGERNDRKLAELTGLDQAVVVRCKKLLSFDKEYQDLMLDPNPELRVKADFFIELYSIVSDRYVKKMEWYKKDIFIQRMLEKYQNRKGIKSVTDFRLIKQHISNAVKTGHLNKITIKLEEFAKDDSLALDHLVVEEADITASAKQMIRTITKLEERIRSLDVERYYGEEELWTCLEKLVAAIKSKLKKADRRTKE